MKKSAFALFLTIIAISFAYAGDVIKVLRVYSGGQCISIPLAGVDSLDHSMYDADGKLYSQYTSSVIHAIDSDYQIPINSIDKIVVDEIDVQQFDAQINEISDFINEQTELEVNAFQANLLAWLNANENIQEATINETKDLIVIKFKNGLDFYIDFQDMSFYDEGSTEAKANIRRTPTDKKSNSDYFDVSFQEEEEIIMKEDILYIEGRSMHKTIGADYIFSEISQIESELDKSPLKVNLVKESKNTMFLNLINRPLDNNGMILISQTHGASDLHGAFQIQDIPSGVANNFGLSLFVKAMDLIDEPLSIKWIRPKRFASKISNDNNQIIFGNYCWSWGLTRYIKNCTFYGYLTQSCHSSNVQYLVEFTSKMFNGKTYKDAILNIIKPYRFRTLFGSLDCVPMTNRPDSKQRYFSIQTDEITETAANGQPIISGKINGYKNLKSDSLTYLIYFHKGDGEFSPENAKEDEYMILKIPGRNDISEFKIEKDGSFSFEFPGYLLTNTKYQMIFAFEYKDNYYFGETKLIEPEEKDNTISEGELVDLGLSVKWASCNFGAEKPNQLGTKIKTDIISEAYKANPDMFNEDGTKADFCRSEYDLAYKQSAGKMRMPTYQELKELKEKCHWELSVVDGVVGVRIVGPNKNSIFLPADTEKTEQPYFGDSYMLNRTVYTSGTYDKNEISWSWGLASILIYGMYMPQLATASFLNIEFGNDFEAYIRPVGN